MRQIARQVGITPGAIYNHYSSKSGQMSTSRKTAGGNLVRVYTPFPCMAADQFQRCLCIIQWLWKGRSVFIAFTLSQSAAGAIRFAFSISASVYHTLDPTSNHFWIESRSRI
jgi:hypothetical protein